jgi:hypothetical protein
MFHIPLDVLIFFFFQSITSYFLHYILDELDPMLTFDLVFNLSVSGDGCSSFASLLLYFDPASYKLAYSKLTLRLF